MLKQSSSGTRKVLAVLLVVFFVVSLIGVSASAREYRNGGHGRYGGDGYWSGYGGYSGCGWVNGVWVCPSYGFPYI
jgi:hypothetical protein